MIVIQSFFNHNIESDHYIPSRQIVSNRNGRLSRGIADGILQLCKIFLPGESPWRSSCSRISDASPEIPWPFSPAQGCRSKFRTDTEFLHRFPVQSHWQKFRIKTVQIYIWTSRKCSMLLMLLQSKYRVFLRNEQLASTYRVKARFMERTIYNINLNLCGTEIVVSKIFWLKFRSTCLVQKVFEHESDQCTLFQLSLSFFSKNLQLLLVNICTIKYH